MEIHYTWKCYTAIKFHFIRVKKNKNLLHPLTGNEFHARNITEMHANCCETVMRPIAISCIVRTHTRARDTQIIGVTHRIHNGHWTHRGAFGELCKYLLVYNIYVRDLHETRIHIPFFLFIVIVRRSNTHWTQSNSTDRFCRINRTFNFAFFSYKSARCARILVLALFSLIKRAKRATDDQWRIPARKRPCRRAKIRRIWFSSGPFSRRIFFCWVCVAFLAAVMVFGVCVCIV